MKKINIIIFVAAALCISIFSSCENKQSKFLVINELMASNRTGLQNGANKPDRKSVV